MNEVAMVQDPSSSRDQEKDKPDILDLKAEPGIDQIEAKEPGQEEAAPAEAVETGPGEAAAETETVSPAADAGPGGAATAEPPSAPYASQAPAGRSAGPSTAALVGAGILGGLIALLAAGSMQYAGYLPGGAPSSGKSSDDIAGLRAEVDGLKQQLATIPAEAAPSDALEKRIAALEDQTAKNAGADPETATKISALEERLAGLQSAADKAQAADGQKIEELSGRLAEAEKTLKEQPGEAAVSRAIAATYLKAAVDRGDPFLTELETFAALSPEDPAVQDLRPLAANGVKSKSALSAEFGDQAKRILDAVNEPESGEGFADRLLASARSLISVRPVGNVEGTDAGAILARMEDKLKNGDVKGAALEWEGLPEAGRKVSEPFKADLDKRAKADDLTRGLAERSATPAVNAG